MKPTILVIGINDSRIIVDASLSSSGISTTDQYCLVSKLIGEFEDSTEANQCFLDNAGIYDYLEIKTVFKSK